MQYLQMIEMQKTKQFQLNEWQNLFTDAKQLRLIILDACRDNPFVPTMKRRQNTALRSISRGLSVVETNAVNMLIAHAAKAGSTAEDGDAGPAHLRRLC